MFYKYQCGYGPKDHYGKFNHTRSIECGYWAHFSIKQLYTWPKVVEIIIYHQTYTQASGELAHDAHDLESNS
jgi:hypothetical protein